MSTIGGATAGFLNTDWIRLVDAALCEICLLRGPPVCLPKSGMRKKIWKGDYVEIFSLLTLEKFNLDMVKPNERKKRRNGVIGLSRTHL